MVECDDDDLRAALERAFRRTPVITDDASYRRFGTHGEVMIPPGDLEWFRAAAFVRAPAEAGVDARLVPGVTEGGYDPAAQYRGFEDSIERLSRRLDASDSSSRALSHRPRSDASHAWPASQNERKSQWVHHRPGVGSNAPSPIAASDASTRERTSAGSSIGFVTSSPLAR